MTERIPDPAGAPYEVYLVDPGARASHVVTLVQEVTRGSTAECATLVHDAPSRIAGFATQQAAEDLAARFREFDAVAIVRRPGEQQEAEPPLDVLVPQPRVPLGVGLIVLGVVQVGLAVWWLVRMPPPESRPELLAAAGMVLGILAVLAGVWKLRTTELD
jgi:hypothetical protein